MRAKHFHEWLWEHLATEAAAEAEAEGNMLDT